MSMGGHLGRGVQHMSEGQVVVNFHRLVIYTCRLSCFGLGARGYGAPERAKSKDMRGISAAAQGEAREVKVGFQA